MKSSDISITSFLTLGMVVLFTSLAATVSAQEVDFVLETPNTVVAPGETFIVSVQLENPEEVSIQGIQHVVSWDSNLLQLLSVTLPGDLEGSPTPLALAWNAPPPAGQGGDTGCSQWWDGDDLEAVSFGLVIDGEWTQILTPLVQMEMRVLSGASSESTTFASPPPDFTCGWLGSIVTDTRGNIVPTISQQLSVQISTLPAPSPFDCAEASEIVYLSWLEPLLYDSLRIERDGAVIAEIAGGIGTYEDHDAELGSTPTYRISGFSASVPSPPSACSVTVDGVIDAPDALSCLDNGSGVLLSWQNRLPYAGLVISRQGSFYKTVAAGTSTFIDTQPLLGIPVIYEVQGVIAGEQGAGSQCQIELPLPEQFFIRGDVNTDGQTNLSDPIITLQYLFIGGEMPCASAADHDDSGSLDLGDGVSLLSYLFAGGSPPALPFPTAGTDPTPDDLGCLEPCPDLDCGGNQEGDECLNSLSIGLGITNFDTTNMTNSPDPYDSLNCPSTFLGQMVQDVWFEFTAPTSGTVTLSTCYPETVPDTDLVVYQGQCGALEIIACNGDGAVCTGEVNFLAEIPELSVTAGTSYLIRLGGFATEDSGLGTLTITSD